MKRKSAIALSEEEAAEGFPEIYDAELLKSLKGRRLGEIVKGVLDTASPKRGDMTIREYLVVKAVGGLMKKTPSVSDLLALQRLEEGSGRGTKEEKEKPVDVFDARLEEMRNGTGEGKADGGVPRASDEADGVHGDVSLDRGQGHGACEAKAEQGTKKAD